MNTQPLHLDAHWSSQQPGFGGERLVNSMWTLSTVVGLSVGQLTLGTIVANLGFTEVAFPAPMFHGDTLYAETVCRNKRRSKSRPNQGIVELEHIGRNQDGTARSSAALFAPLSSNAHRFRLTTAPRMQPQRGSEWPMSTHNSWQPLGPAILFAPADRPERFGKAADRADMVILDLEDGCRAENRDAAREAIASCDLDPARTLSLIHI